MKYKSLLVIAPVVSLFVLTLTVSYFETARENRCFEKLPESGSDFKNRYEEGQRLQERFRAPSVHDLPMTGDDSYKSQPLDEKIVARLDKQFSVAFEKCWKIKYERITPKLVSPPNDWGKFILDLTI